MRPAHLAPALIAAAALALTSTGGRAESAPDKAFGDRVRAYLLAHPEVIQEVQGRLQATQKAREDAAAGALIAAHRQALERDPRDYVAGNPQGATTIVEFFDYRCPYCKSSSPAVFRWLAAHKNVRLVLKEFPILSETSEHAARAAIAAKASGRYLPVHEALLAEKSLDDAAIARVLAAHGLDPAKTKAAGDSALATRQIEDDRTLARTVGADGTPTFVVGGKLVPGWIPAEIEAAMATIGKPAG